MKAETRQKLERELQDFLNKAASLKKRAKLFEIKAQYYEQILEGIESGELSESITLAEVETATIIQPVPIKQAGSNEAEAGTTHLRLAVYRDKKLREVFLEIFKEMSADFNVQGQVALSAKDLVTLIYKPSLTKTQYKDCWTALVVTTNRMVGFGELTRVRKAVFALNQGSADDLELLQLYRERTAQ